MSTTLAWVSLAVALVTAFASSFYMGLMLVLRFVLRTAFGSLTLETLPIYFSQPIIGATRFLKRMFIVYFACSAALVWIGWPHPWPVGFGIVSVASYAFLAIWFLWKMQPVNDELIAGNVATEAELAAKISTWISLNRVRVVTTVIYWLASIGFLVSAHHIWKELLP